MSPEHLEAVNNLRYLEYGVKATKATNDYLANGNRETQEINWYAYNIYKGIVYGAFLRLRGEGSALIGKHILLEDGVPQSLSPRQQEFLDRFDAKFGVDKSE